MLFTFSQITLFKSFCATYNIICSHKFNNRMKRQKHHELALFISEVSESRLRGILSLAFRRHSACHSAEGLRGRARGGGSRTGRSFGGAQRAAEITRAVLRAAFLTAERRSSDWTVTISPYAAAAWRIYSFVITVVDQSRHSVNLVLWAVFSFSRTSSRVTRLSMLTNSLRRN